MAEDEQSPGFYGDDDGEIEFVTPPPKLVRRMKCLDEAEFDRRQQEIAALRAEVERLTEGNGRLLRAVQLATNATDAAERGHGQAALETGEWQERAERAEALLAKATEFHWPNGGCVWQVEIDATATSRPTLVWRAEIEMDRNKGTAQSLFGYGRNPYFETRDEAIAALAAYEQSRESGE